MSALTHIDCTLSYILQSSHCHTGSPFKPNTFDAFMVTLDLISCATLAHLCQFLLSELSLSERGGRLEPPRL